MYTWLCEGMYACTYLCRGMHVGNMHTCVHAYMETRSQHSVSSSITCHVIFETVLHWTWSSVVRLPQKAQISAFPALELRYTSQHWTFMWTLGIKLSSSCLCSKYFDDWATSPTPTYINNILGTLLALHHLIKTRILQVPEFRPISLTRKVKFQCMKVSCICSHSHLFIFLHLSCLLATFIVIYF